jgi:hypothetical protein
VPVSAHTQVTDLALNDHACLTFGEQEELLDLTAAFVRDGLASGSRVVGPGGFSAERAMEWLRGQLAGELDLLPHVSLVGVHD